MTPKLENFGVIYLNIQRMYSRETLPGVRKRTSRLWFFKIYPLLRLDLAGRLDGDADGVFQIRQTDRVIPQSVHPSRPGFCQ